jgi:hypothetical protein
VSKVMVNSTAAGYIGYSWLDDGVGEFIGWDGFHSFRSFHSRVKTLNLLSNY